MFKQDISLKINFWQVVFVKFLIGPNDIALGPNDIALKERAKFC